jgi:superfamily II DNA helicase RecQ
MSVQIVAKGHDKLPFAGKGEAMDRGDAERLFQLLASESALGERFERNALGFTNAYVTVGTRSKAVLNGTLKLSMAFAEGGAKKAAKPKAGAKQLAAKKGQPVRCDTSEDEVEDVDYDEEVQVVSKDWAKKKAGGAKAAAVEEDLPMQCLEELRTIRYEVSRRLLVAKSRADDREQSACEQDCVPQGVLPDDSLEVGTICSLQLSAY